MINNITPIQIEQNARALYKALSKGNPLRSSENSLRTISSFNFISRVIFWIKDRWGRGSETARIEQITLKTLELMSQQLDQKNPRWHFSYLPDWGYGMDMEPDVQTGLTYQDLSKKIQSHPRFKNSQVILNKVQEILIKMKNLEPIKDFEIKPILRDVQSTLNQVVIEMVCRDNWNDDVVSKDSSLTTEDMERLKKGKVPRRAWEDYFQYDPSAEWNLNRSKFTYVRILGERLVVPDDTGS